MHPTDTNKSPNTREYHEYLSVYIVALNVLID